MFKFKVDTWGYSGKDFAVLGNGTFIKYVQFEENELSLSGMTWDYDMYSIPSPVYSDKSKELISSKAATIISEYAKENKLLGYTVEYPWGVVTKKPECECGSDSARHTRHSWYCPKYEKL